MTDTITMAHGAGGKQTSELIHGIFEKHLGNEYFTADDAAVLPPVCGRLAMTTDGFIVSPQFFPGGNIGKLSICGTVNDLSCMGARPLYMTCAFVIEEGFRIDELDQIAAAMAKTAGEAGVRLVAGDTKVAGKGQCGGVFITTTGVGEIVEGVRMSGACARPGDAVIVTGDIGRHGTAILLARDDYLSSGLRPHVIRDATRGGVGTVLYEIAAESGVGIRLETEKIPVQPAVRGVTGMLGLEPLYLACEGRLVIICPQEETGRLMEILHGQTCTEGAAVIGCITAENKGRVVMTTQIGAQTLLPEPGNELLPRIC